MTKKTKLWLPLLVAMLMIATVVVAACTKTATVSYAKGADGATGTVPEAQEVAVGEEITLKSNPFTYEGHTFAGWSDGTETYKAGDKYTVLADVTFTATWTKVSDDKHVCGHVCETCHKCTDTACTDSVCSDKCQGHQPEPVLDSRSYFLCGSINGWSDNGGDYVFTRTEGTNTYTLQNVELHAGDEIKLRYNTKWNDGATQYSYGAHFFPTSVFVESTAWDDNAVVKAGADGIYDITLKTSNDLTATTGRDAGQITEFTFTKVGDIVQPVEPFVTAPFNGAIGVKSADRQSLIFFMSTGAGQVYVGDEGGDFQYTIADGAISITKGGDSIGSGTIVGNVIALTVTVGEDTVSFNGEMYAATVIIGGESADWYIALDTPLSLLVEYMDLPSDYTIKLDGQVIPAEMLDSVKMDKEHHTIEVVFPEPQPEGFAAIVGVWSNGTSTVIISEAGADDDYYVGSLLINNEFVYLWAEDDEYVGYDSMWNMIYVYATDSGIQIYIYGDDETTIDYTSKSAIQDASLSDFVGTWKRTDSESKITINSDGTASVSMGSASNVQLYVVDQYVVVTYEIKIGYSEYAYQFVLTKSGDQLVGYYTEEEKGPVAVTLVVYSGEEQPDPDQPDEVPKPELKDGETLFEGESTRTVAGDNTLIIRYIVIDIRSNTKTARFIGLYNGKYFDETLSNLNSQDKGWYEGPNHGSELYYYDQGNLKGAKIEMAVFSDKIILCSDWDTVIPDGTFTFVESKGGTVDPDPSDKCGNPDCDCEGCTGEGCTCGTFEPTTDTLDDVVGTWEGSIVINGYTYTKLEITKSDIRIYGEDVGWVDWTLWDYSGEGKYFVVTFKKDSSYSGTLTLVNGELVIAMNDSSVSSGATFTRAAEEEVTPLPEDADGTYKNPDGMSDFGKAMNDEEGYSFTQAVLADDVLTLSVDGKYASVVNLTWNGNVGTGKFNMWYNVTVVATEGQLEISITITGSGTFTATFTKDAGTTEPEGPGESEDKFSDFGGDSSASAVVYGYTSYSDASGASDVLQVADNRLLFKIEFYYGSFGGTQCWGIKYYYKTSAGATNDSNSTIKGTTTAGGSELITSAEADATTFYVAIYGYSVSVEFGHNEAGLRTVTLTVGSTSVTWTEIQA